MLIRAYCDYQLSKVRGKFGDQVLTFNLSCGHGQLAVFPVATCNCWHLCYWRKSMRYFRQ